MADLDEAVFEVPGVVNFQAELTAEKGAHRLRTTIHCDARRFVEIATRIRAKLVRLAGVRAAVAAGKLEIDPIELSPGDWFTTGAAKRTLTGTGKERTTG